MGDSSVLWLRVAAGLYSLGLLDAVITVMRRREALFRVARKVKVCKHCQPAAHDEDLARHEGARQVSAHERVGRVRQQHDEFTRLEAEEVFFAKEFDLGRVKPKIYFKVEIPLEQ